MADLTYMAEVDGKKVTIVVSDSNRGECLMFVEYLGFGFTKEGVYENPIKLSASLRSEMALSHAIQVLEHMQVPTNSSLWHLNYDNPHLHS